MRKVAPDKLKGKKGFVVSERFSRTCNTYDTDARFNVKYS
jgi:hypothetical protein